MALFQPKIAAGHNNAIGYTLFSALNASDGREFLTPKVLASYSPGIKVLRANKSITFEGDGTCKLKFSWLTPKQLKYLNTTYCSGLYWGNVTLYLNLLTEDDYDDYNAILTIPAQIELESLYDPVMLQYDNVELPVMELVAV